MGQRRRGGPFRAHVTQYAAHGRPPPSRKVRYISGLRAATAVATDERVRLTSEAVGGVLAAKMLV